MQIYKEPKRLSFFFLMKENSLRISLNSFIVSGGLSKAGRMKVALKMSSNESVNRFFFFLNLLFQIILKSDFSF